ncbi:hypothetical protein D1872_182780 [compost metagenome]
MDKSKMKRGIACSIAAFTLLAGGTTWAQDPSFTDVSSSHWAWKNGAISWGVKRHVISGYGDGTFKPDKATTEAEFLSMLIGLSIPSLAKTGNDWTEPYYKKAQSLRYPLAGLNNTKARHMSITREKVAELIAAINGAYYTGDDAIRYVLGKKLAFGKIPGVISIASYRGKDTLTRAEAVQFLKNVYEQGRKELKPRPEQPSDPALLPSLPGDNEQNRPTTKEETVYIEGMPEKMMFHLFRQQGWPFTTYYPSDMIANTASSGEGDSVRMIANFGGKRNADAFLHIFFPSKNIHPEEMIRAYDYKAEHEQSTKETPWASKAYAYQANGKFHRLLLGKHGERYFIIQIQYPMEYGDGMAPRIAKILEEWRWSDSGNLL